VKYTSHQFVEGGSETTGVFVTGSGGNVTADPTVGVSVTVNNPPTSIPVMA
jgi:hypothetical protein